MPHRSRLERGSSNILPATTSEKLVACANDALLFPSLFHREAGSLSSVLRAYCSDSCWIKEEYRHAITPYNQRRCSESSDMGASLIACKLADALRHIVPRPAAIHERAGFVKKLFADFSPEPLQILSLQSGTLYTLLARAHQELESLDNATSSRGNISQKALRSYLNEVPPLVEEATASLQALECALEKVKREQKKLEKSSQKNTPESGELNHEISREDHLAKEARRALITRSDTLINALGVMLSQMGERVQKLEDMQQQKAQR